MAKRVCRAHKRENCSTCRAEARRYAETDTSGTATTVEAALWATVYDSPSSSYGGGDSYCGGGD